MYTFSSLIWLYLKLYSIYALFEKVGAYLFEHILLCQSLGRSVIHLVGRSPTICANAIPIELQTLIHFRKITVRYFSRGVWFFPLQTESSLCQSINENIISFKMRFLHRLFKLCSDDIWIIFLQKNFLTPHLIMIENDYRTITRSNEEFRFYLPFSNCHLWRIRKNLVLRLYNKS